MITPATRSTLHKLALTALRATYGTQEHDDAHNAFCEDAAEVMTKTQHTAWEAFCSKATPAECVVEACRILDPTLHHVVMTEHQDAYK